jgi:hypothetical protein
MADLARLQYGVVDHLELAEIGLSGSAIHRWAADGRLHRLYRGVYAVGHPAVVGHGRWLAAVKACGREAVLSHQSAAALWELRGSSSSFIDVTTPRRSSPRGLRVHRVRQLHPEDRAVVGRIPVTSVARTCIDCAEVLSLREMVRIFEQAERLQIFDLRAIEQLLARCPRRRGASRMRAAIVALTGEPPRVNSDWERDLLDFCEDYDIPKPELNVIVAGYEVDALWREKKVIVELDSYAFHRSLRAFEGDRHKYATVQLAGYMVLPLTRLDDAAARMISAAIAAR